MLADTLSHLRHDAGWEHSGQTPTWVARVGVSEENDTTDIAAEVGDLIHKVLSAENSRVVGIEEAIYGRIEIAPPSSLVVDGVRKVGRDHADFV